MSQQTTEIDAVARKLAVCLKDRQEEQISEEKLKIFLLKQVNTQVNTIEALRKDSDQIAQKMCENVDALIIYVEYFSGAAKNTKLPIKSGQGYDHDHTQLSALSAGVFVVSGLFMIGNLSNYQYLQNHGTPDTIFTGDSLNHGWILSAAALTTGVALLALTVHLIRRSNAISVTTDNKILDLSTAEKTREVAQVRADRSNKR